MTLIYYWESFGRGNCRKVQRLTRGDFRIFSGSIKTLIKFPQLRLEQIAKSSQLLSTILNEIERNLFAYSLRDTGSL